MIVEFKVTVPFRISDDDNHLLEGHVDEHGFYNWDMYLTLEFQKYLSECPQGVEDFCKIKPASNWGSIATDIYIYIVAVSGPWVLDFFANGRDLLGNRGDFLSDLVYIPPLLFIIFQTTMENIEQYQYQPLPQPTSIRLIRLHSGAGSAEFSCSLVVADVSNPPEYIALSYVWGDPPHTVPILCDKRTVQVPLNLRDALQRFREVSTYLWADALCIDQRNFPERNQQVKVMADIYKNAAIVNVWLGLDEKGDADLVFQDIKALVEGLATIHSLGGTFRHFDAETGDLHWVLGDGRRCVSALPPALIDPDKEELARLKRFFCQPWFSRTWVLQEVGLASHAVVLWGGLAIEWHPIGITALFLMQHCGALLERLGLAAEVNKVYHLYTTFSPFIPLATFLHVLDKARRFEATDPRDKVFALLSHPTSGTISTLTVPLDNVASFEPYRELAIHFLPSYGEQYLVRNSTRHSSSLARQLQEPLFEADYSRPVEEVYRLLTLDRIRRTSSLEILTAVQHDPTSISLTNFSRPTWVPRWDQFHHMPILGLSTSDHIASANRDAIFSSSPSSPSTLTVRGIVLDTIPFHTLVLHASDFDLPLPTTTTPLTPDSEPVQRLWTSCPIANVWLRSGLAKADPNTYPQLGWPRVGSDLIAAYRAAWVGGKSLGKADNFHVEPDFWAYWDRLFWGSPRARRTGSNEQQRPEDEDVDEDGDDDQFADDEEDLEGKNGRWQRYRDTAVYVCDKRKFFITSMGFFGIGPGALMVGDVVAVLLGADVPFVLRRVPAAEYGEGGEAQDGKGQKYALVGECSVRGLMQGQAIRAGLEQRDIVLI